MCICSTLVYIRNLKATGRKNHQSTEPKMKPSIQSLMSTNCQEK